MSEACFTPSAIRLAGDAALLLHWRPDDFWAATPADLSHALAAFARTQSSDAPPDAATIHLLKGMFPDE